MARHKMSPDQQAQTDPKEAAAIEALEADEDPRQQAIAEAAYYKAEQRGFAPGSETRDWLDAERELGYGDARQ